MRCCVVLDRVLLPARGSLPISTLASGAEDFADKGRVCYEEQ